jgi:hypothetical protein
MIVDLRHIRCGNCKVALGDELVATCPVCGAAFTHVTSNHVGLAESLRKKRRSAGIFDDQDSVEGRGGIHSRASPV